MSRARPITHEEALDLAPLFVLDALDVAEAAEVRAHLQSCTQPHAEFQELGAVVAHLPAALTPVDAPLEVRDRVAALVRSEPNVAAAPAAPPSRGVPRDWSVPIGRGMQLLQSASPARLGAVLVIGLLALSTFALGAQLRDASEREALLRGAMAAVSDPAAIITPLSGGAGRSVSGFAAFPPGEAGYLLVRGLPAAPSGKAYQAWFLAAKTPTSAGLLRSAGDLLALGGLTLPRNVDGIALTLEASQGAERPTSEPVAEGRVPA